MKSYEIFREMNPETVLSIFAFLRNEQRDVYTASLSTLATNRKLRPVFIQRKPGREQVAWMAKHIQLKTSAEVAEQVLQLWLLKAHSDLLISFLDGMGIEHDGEGAAEDIPDDLDAKQLTKTADKLLESHDRELVAVYLHTFQLQRPGGWSEIADLVASRPELQLTEPAEPPEASSSPDSPEPDPAEEEKAAPAQEEREEREEREDESDSGEDASEKKAPPQKPTSKAASKKAPAKKGATKKAAGKKAATKKAAPKKKKG